MFSASRPARSEISFLLLFLFAIFPEHLSNSANVNDEISQCSDDSQHFCPVDERLRLADARHASIL